MRFQCHLRGKTVYVPTTAKYDAGMWTEAEPVDAVPVSDSDGLRRALERAYQAGNPVLPTPSRWDNSRPMPRSAYPPPLCIKYAKVRSWGEYARRLKIWTIDEHDDGWLIQGCLKGERAFFRLDPEQATPFPPGTPVDVVMDRMIAILQESAGVASPGKAAG